MNKEECWEYYQDLLKQNGFDGITDLLSEYHELQKMVDKANAQEPVWVNCADRLPKKEDADIAGNITCRWHNGEVVAIPWSDVEVGDDEWLSRPIPAQQSPAVVVPENAAFIPMLNGKPEITNRMKAECMGNFTITIEHSCSSCAYHGEQEDCEVCGGEINYSQKHQVPWDTCKSIYKAMATVAIIPAAQSPNITDPTELELHRADYRAIKSAGFESPGELLAAYKHLLSNRVTEQDAREILNAYWASNADDDDWVTTAECRALLDNLNKAK